MPFPPPPPPVVVQEWQAGTVTALGSLLAIDSTILDLGTVAAHSIIGNAGTGSAEPAAFGIGAGLTFSAGSLINSGQTVPIAAGTGISVSSGTITNTGQTSPIAAGTGISVSSGTITNTGQTVPVVAGTGISVSSGTITNSGQTVPIAAGSSITVSSGTITNNGVRSITAGTGVSVSGTNAVTVTNTGQTSAIVAGSGIAITNGNTIAVGGATSSNVLASILGPVGNGADMSEDTLLSYSLPSNTLASGVALRITFCAHTSSSTDNKAFKCYFGGTLLYSKASTTTGQVYVVTFYVQWTSASHQQGHYTAFLGSNSYSSTNVTTSTEGGGALTETDSSPIVIKMTGQDTTANTANVVVGDYLLVEKFTT